MDNTWLDLEGKVVIVTGGSSGIGYSIAKELVNNGAKVIISDLAGEEGPQSDGSYLIKCDVTNKESVDQMVSQTVEQFGKIDILVNNAGVNLPRLLVDVKGEKPQYELSEKDFDFMECYWTLIDWIYLFPTISISFIRTWSSNCSNYRDVNWC